MYVCCVFNLQTDIPQMVTFSQRELSGFSTCMCDSLDLEGKLISDQYLFMTFIPPPECHTKSNEQLVVTNVKMFITTEAGKPQPC